MSSKNPDNSSYINYRNSKLTYLLSDSLGGNSKTIVICNISSSYFALKESKSTLIFASNAKQIKNKILKNEESSSLEFWKNKYF